MWYGTYQTVGLPIKVYYIILFLWPPFENPGSATDTLVGHVTDTLYPHITCSFPPQCTLVYGTVVSRPNQLFQTINQNLHIMEHNFSLLETLISCFVGINVTILCKFTLVFEKNSNNSLIRFEFQHMIVI